MAEEELRLLAREAARRYREYKKSERETSRPSGTGASLHQPPDFQGQQRQHRSARSVHPQRAGATRHL
jgi:hypothetical protein